MKSVKNMDEPGKTANSSMKSVKNVDERRYYAGS